MHSFMLRLTTILGIVMLLSACGGGTAGGTQGGGGTGLALPELPCGRELLGDVLAVDGRSFGVFEVLNDSSNLWFALTPGQRYALVGAAIYAGPLEQVPREGLAMDPANFPIRIENAGGTVNWAHHVPLRTVGDCYAVAAYLKIAERQQPSNVAYAWVRGKSDGFGGYYLNYCTQECRAASVACDNGTAAGEFRTVPPEEWGASAENRRYLDEAFARAFPAGLSIGCSETIRLTEVDAVLRLLATKGKPAPIAESVENPQAGQAGNSFAAELCALGLALQIDQAIPEFGGSPASLSELLIASGPFAGWKVSEFYAEGNTVIGGCASNYSPEQMEAILRQINQNFLNGVESQGFLRCRNSDPS